MVDRSDLIAKNNQLPAVIKRNEDIVTARFWPKVKKVLGQVPFMDDLLAAYFCAMDSETPSRVRGVLLAALAYFILPTDVIPDFVIGLGFTDDASVISLALMIVAGHVKLSHKNQARAALGQSLIVSDDP